MVLNHYKNIFTYKKKHITNKTYNNISKTVSTRKDCDIILLKKKEMFNYRNERSNRNLFT